MNTLQPTTYAMRRSTLAGAGLVAFCAITSFIWILLVAFNPDFVKFRECGSSKPECGAPADPKRALGWAILITLILAVIAWFLRGY